MKLTRNKAWNSRISSINPLLNHHLTIEFARSINSPHHQSSVPPARSIWTPAPPAHEGLRFCLQLVLSMAAMSRGTVDRMGPGVVGWSWTCWEMTGWLVVWLTSFFSIFLGGWNHQRDDDRMNKKVVDHGWFAILRRVGNELWYDIKENTQNDTYLKFTQELIFWETPHMLHMIVLACQFFAVIHTRTGYTMKHNQRIYFRIKLK